MGTTFFRIFHKPKTKDQSSQDIINDVIDVFSHCIKLTREGKLNFIRLSERYSSAGLEVLESCEHTIRKSRSLTKAKKSLQAIQESLNFGNNSKMFQRISDLIEILDIMIKSDK